MTPSVRPEWASLRDSHAWQRLGCGGHIVHVRPRIAMYEEVSIPVADLQLDTGNPRFGEEQESQQAAALKLAKQQGRNRVKLAEDIVDFGLDPTALVAVVATSDRHRKYKVVEGNRRVLALKALETPTLVAGALASAEERRLQQLSSRYHQGDQVESVRCVL